MRSHWFANCDCLAAIANEGALELPKYIVVPFPAHPFFVIRKLLLTISNRSYRAGESFVNDMNVYISIIAIRVCTIKVDQRVGSRWQARDRLIGDGYNPGLLVGDLREKLTKCGMWHVQALFGGQTSEIWCGKKGTKKRC